MCVPPIDSHVAILSYPLEEAGNQVYYLSPNKTLARLKQYFIQA